MLFRSGTAGHGVGLIVENSGKDGVFPARSLGAAFFIRAEGPLGEAAGERGALFAAFERGGFAFLKSLRWKVLPSPNRSVFIGEGWSLAFDRP